MISRHHGLHMDMADLRRRFTISLKGATLAQLMRHASALHFATRPLRAELDELDELVLPCILHWNMNHFVVLKEVRKTLRGKVKLTLLDPAMGERVLSLEEASACFTGVVLELTPSEAFVRKDERKPLSIRDLTGRIVGLRRAVAQVIVLSAALELFAIAAPLFNQFVLDNVIVAGDLELLTVLVLAFGMLMITQTAIGLARSWFLMRWSLEVGYQWRGRIFGHLVRLPVTYFEKRRLGDIVSRFSSIGSIQSTLTSLFVESLLDGIMTLIALGMMLIYSPKLTCVVCLGVLCYCLLRWCSYGPFREASQERLLLSARENSHFLETIRAITPLKLFGREDERSAQWHNLRMDVQNRDIRTQKMSILYKVANSTLSGAQNLALFYFGAGLVIENMMSVGMLMAFSSYAGTFAGRVYGLIDLFVNVKILSMHSERLSDIVREEAEPEAVQETDLSRLRGDLTLKGVKFRYAEGEPWVLNGIDLHIPAGQSLCLVGPSGCGKTTLCKILLGLLKPCEGEVYIDNIPVRQLGLATYRRLIGTVMQDDILLAGSIADNICFFDTQCDKERVEQCARQAAVHAEISAMPMGYQTLVGEMGSSLSGGQKQRVLLARALYKSPLILALDEATSHLDIENEHKVNLALRGLSLTRIMVAHRPETIKAAERVIALNGGTALELELKADDGAGAVRPQPVLA